jgi:hypothetical protein
MFAGMFAGFLLLISPLMAFLMLGHQDVFPLVKTGLVGVAFFVSLAVLMPARSPLPYVLSCMSIAACGICIAQLIQMPAMFDYVVETSVGGISLITALPAWIALYIAFGLKQSNRDFESIDEPEPQPVFSNSAFWIAGLGLTIITVMISSLTAGSCIAPFGEALPGPKIFFSDSMFINSRAVRAPGCSEGICHVYLTAGEDLTSSVFVNVHVAASVENVKIDFFHDVQLHAISTESSGLDSQDRRQVLYGYIEGLESGKDYDFRILAGDHKSETYKFRLPNIDGIKMSIGGDAGVTHTSRKIIQLMHSSNPDLIVVGGDMAYDNGIAACACLWDEFLKMMDLRTPDGRIVPFTFAVGNHDIGYNHANRDGWKHRSNPIPILFSWFPHQVGVPVEHRSMNRRHRLGDTANIWILDSEYTSSLDEVVQFVDKSLASTPSPESTVNIGVYHVPMYSVHIHDYHRGDSLREVWPKQIFDKHRFVANFENHSHLFKRTKPLVDSKAVASGTGGTVYLGDGNIGVSEDRDDAAAFVQEKDDRLITKGVDFHYFAITISATGRVTIDAINPLGNVIDHVTIEGSGNVQSSS